MIEHGHVRFPRIKIYWGETDMENLTGEKLRDLRSRIYGSSAIDGAKDIAVKIAHREKMIIYCDTHQKLSLWMRRQGKEGWLHGNICQEIPQFSDPFINVTNLHF